MSIGDRTHWISLKLNCPFNLSILFTTLAATAAQPAQPNLPSQHDRPPRSLPLVINVVKTSEKNQGAHQLGGSTAISKRATRIQTGSPFV